MSYKKQIPDAPFALPPANDAPPDRSWLAGLYPPYWAIKAYWLAEAGDPNWWPTLLVGAVFMSATLVYLTRRFGRLVRG